MGKKSTKLSGELLPSHPIWLTISLTGEPFSCCTKAKYQKIFSSHVNSSLSFETTNYFAACPVFKLLSPINAQTLSSQGGKRHYSRTQELQLLPASQAARFFRFFRHSMNNTEAQKWYPGTNEVLLTEPLQFHNTLTPPAQLIPISIGICPYLVSSRSRDMEDNRNIFMVDQAISKDYYHKLFFL